MEKDTRFQYQPWYIKLWRYKWYCLIPYWTCRIFVICSYTKENLSIRTCWSISKGLAQTKMQWFYFWEEIKEIIGEYDENIFDD